MSACFLLFGFLIFFFFSICRCKHAHLLSSTPHKEPGKKLMLSIFLKGTMMYNSVQASYEQPYDHYFRRKLYIAWVFLNVLLLFQAAAKRFFFST